MDGARSSSAAETTLTAAQPLPPVLVFGAALTCGTLTALVAHIFLIKAGLSVAGLSRDPFAAPLAMTRAALAWWTIAAVGCAVGMITASTLRNEVGRWPHTARWVVGASLVMLLANAGHAANVPAANGGGMTLAVNLGALTLASIMSSIGARVAMSTRPTKTHISKGS